MRSVANVSAQLLVLPEFLGAEECDRLRGEIDSAKGVPCGVSSYGTVTVNEEIRRTMSARVSATTLAMIQARLQELKPQVESRYNLRLGPCETPQFLVYREGDYFSLHEDSANDPHWPLRIRARRISVVLFLNSQSPDPGPDVYGGGFLCFFDLLGGLLEKYAKVGGQRGQLVAFPSWLPHMVTKVRHGTRYSIVSWFPDEGFKESVEDVNAPVACTEAQSAAAPSSCCQQD